MSRSYNDHGKNYYIHEDFKVEAREKQRSMNKRLLDELKKLDVEDEEAIESIEAKTLGEEKIKVDPWRYY